MTNMKPAAPTPPDAGIGSDGAGEVRAFRNKVVRILEEMYSERTHSDTEAFAYERAAKEVRALCILATQPGDGGQA